MTLDDCITLCCACRQECLRTMQLCLNRGGKLADSTLSLRLTETMRQCQLAADCCTTQSEVMRSVCESAALECDQTVVLCTAMDSPELARGVETLSRCADALREVASGAAEPGEPPLESAGRPV